ncbi:MAG: N-acetylmuramoyl-L-alanine amidase [Lachnospiraceae bacterium]|nr:N-acetylmuramoyl-L-alanine amidase [Lachnospiraceae bacterium]
MNAAVFHVFAADITEGDNMNDTIKICIDPGHGGENLGAEWNGYLEKDMTMIVARSMKEELEKYQGIEVYMTRTEDVDMSLEERVDYAASVDADFFFCLHFNMSAEHDMYGAECWVSAFGNDYARGFDFSKIEMGLLTDLGLYDRGIKTRLNSEGTNYYGVLRMADLEDMPAVIIEHCHLDNYNDEPFYDEYDWLVEYGKLDATAVAMYYGLYSQELGKDYSDYTYEPTPVPSECVKPDLSPPDKPSVSYGEPYETESGVKVDAILTASDPDSRMLYYSYSDDGGITWSERFRWADDEGQLIGDSILTDTIHTTLDVRSDRDMYVIFKVYNLYNLDSDSAPYYIEAVAAKGTEADEISSEAATGDPDTEYTTIDRTEKKDSDDKDDNPFDRSDYDNAYIFGFAALALGILLVISTLGYIIYSHRPRRR